MARRMKRGDWDWRDFVDENKKETGQSKWDKWLEEREKDDAVYERIHKDINEIFYINDKVINDINVYKSNS